MDVTVLRPALLWGSAGLGAALVGVALMLWASSAAISAVVCGVAALALLLALDLYFTRKPPQWWVCPGGLVWQEGEASPSIATP